MAKVAISEAALARRRARGRAWYAANKDKAKAWYLANKEKALAAHRAWYALNKEHVRKYQQTYYAANPENKRRYQRGWYEKNRADRCAKLRTAGWRRKGYPEPTRAEPAGCEICSLMPKANGSLSLDHDHKTGKFRGWLCFSCNTTLGKFKDDPALLRRAIVYLEIAGRR